MMKSAVLLAAALSGTLASWPALAQPILRPHVVTVPNLNTASSVGVGEAIYTETRGISRLVARANGTQIVTKQGGKILPGADLPAETVQGRTVYCADVFTVGPGFAFLCLEDKNGDGRLDAIFAKRYKQPKGLVVDLPFEQVEVPVADASQQRRELLYQGAGGGVLRLLYREFSGDMIRPAFSQEATYTLGETETEVSFKGARFRVTEAGNSKMSYVVLAGFGG